MNESRRKRLITYLGECWHICSLPYPIDCDKCRYKKIYGCWRTFTTWTDMGALISRIVEKGEWDKFLRFAEKSYKQMLESKHDRGCHCTYCHDYMAWLISSPAHFAEVAGEWLEGRA